ncbi:dUTP diphosphatase [Paenibacillus sp. SI8]|uniref:dUTP diphosphatase n=1 Tax=unclassified Paenibacillus TaxID=185978 RepID=UPI003466C43B
MNVNICKTHPDAVIPQYATAGAAGFDLVAVEDIVILPGETAKVPLGLAFEIPEGYVMYVCMRSGIALKTKLRQPNGIGVIDSDFRGEVAMMFDNVSEDYGEWIYGLQTLTDPLRWDIGATYPAGTYLIRKGDRVAQGVIAPVNQAQFNVVDTLSVTERGTGGFGSTGTRAEVYA